MSPHSLGDHTIPTTLLDPNLRWHSLCYNNVRHFFCICLNDALLRLVTLYYLPTSVDFSLFNDEYVIFSIYKNVIFYHINDKNVVK